MKSQHIALVAVAAAALVGCSGRNAALTRTALDCPAAQGELKRVSAAAGRCTYANADGDEVELRLVQVSGAPEAALKSIEQELQAQIPPPAPKAATEAETSADRAKAQAQADAGAATAETKDPDQANISLPGVHIQAGDDKAEVRIGTLHVDAAGGGAVVREAHAVRLKGESLSPQRRGYRATYVVAGEDLPNGLKSYGYEAGGPQKGPLTVAVMRVKSANGDDVHRDARRLVRLNGGI